MKNFIATFLVFLTFSVFAQNEQLAANYFDRGDFEKALVSYEELLVKQPGNTNYFQKTVDCYQQLSQFEKAEKLILFGFSICLFGKVVTSCIIFQWFCLT